MERTRAVAERVAGLLVRKAQAQAKKMGRKLILPQDPDMLRAAIRTLFQGHRRLGAFLSARDKRCLGLWLDHAALHSHMKKLQCAQNTTVSEDTAPASETAGSDLTPK